MDKLKVVQIGVGNFGKKRREIMRESGCFKMLAAYDLDSNILNECCVEENATPVNSYHELLEFPGAEAVIISTGAKFHAEQIITAAQKGLHVFVEKPLCSTVDEILRLKHVQQETGIVVGVGHCDHRTDPLTSRMKEIIENKSFGQVCAFEKTVPHYIHPWTMELWL